MDGRLLPPVLVGPSPEENAVSRSGVDPSAVDGNITQSTVFCPSASLFFSSQWI
jgi:hypothetical protein